MDESEQLDFYAAWAAAEEELKEKKKPKRRLPRAPQSTNRSRSHSRKRRRRRAVTHDPYLDFGCLGEFNWFINLFAFFQRSFNHGIYKACLKDMMHVCIMFVRYILRKHARTHDTTYTPVYSRIPSVYPPYTHRIPPYTLRIPPVYPPYTYRIPPYTPVYRPYTHRIPPYTPVYPPYTHRIPRIPTVYPRIPSVYHPYTHCIPTVYQPSYAIYLWHAPWHLFDWYPSVCCQESGGCGTTRRRTGERTHGSISLSNYPGDSRKCAGHWTWGRRCPAHGGDVHKRNRAPCMKLIFFLYDGHPKYVLKNCPFSSLNFVSSSHDETKQISGLLPRNPRLTSLNSHQRRWEPCFMHALDHFLASKFFLLETANKQGEPHHLNVIESKFHQRKSQPLEEQHVHQTASNTSDAHLETILKQGFAPWKAIFELGRDDMFIYMGRRERSRANRLKTASIFKVQTLKERSRANRLKTASIFKVQTLKERSGSNRWR